MQERVPLKGSLLFFLMVGLVLDVVACKTWVPQAVASLLLGGGPRGPKVDVSLLVIGARSWHV